MKAVEQQFHAVLLIMLYKEDVAPHVSILMKPKCVTIQLKAFEQDFCRFFLHFTRYFFKF